MRGRPRPVLVPAPGGTESGQCDELGPAAQDLHVHGETGGQGCPCRGGLGRWRAPAGHQCLRGQHHRADADRTGQRPRAAKARREHGVLGSLRSPARRKVGRWPVRLDDDLAPVRQSQRPDGIDATGSEQHRVDLATQMLLGEPGQQLAYTVRPDVAVDGPLGAVQGLRGQVSKPNGRPGRPAVPGSHAASRPHAARQRAAGLACRHRRRGIRRLSTLTSVDPARLRRSVPG